LHDLDEMYEPYVSTLAAMQASLSWRLTAPLRTMRRVAWRG